MHCSCLISYIIYQVLSLMSDRLYLETCKLCFAQKKLKYRGMDCFFLYSKSTQNAVIYCRCFYCKLFQSPGLFFKWVMTLRNRSKVYIAFFKFDLCFCFITVFINVWSFVCGFIELVVREESLKFT